MSKEVLVSPEEQGKAQKEAKTDTDTIPFRTTRRSMLGLSAAAAAATLAAQAGINLYPHRKETIDTLDFALNRHQPDKESYMHPNPRDMLPREKSDELFEKLKLEKKYPQTLNKDAFHLLSQRITRLATLYFKPDSNRTDEAIENDFYSFNENFFRKLTDTCSQLEVDFPSTLLMWQVSAANTSSVKSYQQDIRDELLRVGAGSAENLIGQSSGPLIINVARKINSIIPSPIDATYYALPRIQGGVSLGIHDVENIMITRGLKDLENSLPERWKEIEDYLRSRAPRYFNEYSRYTENYNRFEEMAETIAEKVKTSGNIQTYLRKFYTPQKMKDIMTSGETVDAYQFLRTTLFWAVVSEFNQDIQARAHVTTPEIIERLALRTAIDQYNAQENPSGFFLDQFANPKIVAILKEDEGHDPVAEELLGYYRKFHAASDQLIAKDRSVSAAVEKEGLEQDLEFQLLTGVAYTRWLLHDAYKHTHKEDTKRIGFDTSHETAFHSFLATSNREAGPSYQLAATRPLERASSTFLPPEVNFGTMDNFIKNVYHKFEPVSPLVDYKTFARYFIQLAEERYFTCWFGTNRYLLDSDPKIERFIKDAVKFGAYENLIVPPHSSWMRSLEATVGYISEMTKTNFEK